MTGLYGISQPVLPFCPSGDCTWDSLYSSLAVCSKCVDVKDHIQIQVGQVPPYQTCNASLPSGALLTDDPDYFMSVKSDTSRENSWMTLSKFDVISATPAQRDCGPTTFTALQCTLNLCVNTYNASNARGNWQEHILSSWTSDSTRATTSSYFFNPPPDKVAPEQNSTFYIFETDVTNFSNWASGQMSGKAWSDVGGVEGYATYDNDVVHAFAKSSNISELMAGVSQSMTTTIRQKSTDTAKGTVWNTQSFVHVRWRWIILLLVLEVLSATFLAIIIVLSTRSEIPAWKSSALPVLRCRLTASAARSMDAVQQVHDMQHVGDEIAVVMQHSNHSTALQEH